MSQDHVSASPIKGSQLEGDVKNHHCKGLLKETRLFKMDLWSEDKAVLYAHIYFQISVEKLASHPGM